MMSLIVKRYMIVTVMMIALHSLWGQSSIDGQIKINRDKDFKGEALYGFMNGGSELFLEYGFNTLKALEIDYKGEKFSVEIYQMDSPESAFGIYSQHTFKCSPADEFYTFDCSSPGQYQATSGNIYISIVSETRKPDYRQAAKELAEYYINRFKSSEELRIPEVVAQSTIKGEEISNVVKFARGPIALSNSLSSHMLLFENISPYKIWTVSYGGDIAIALVKFESAEDYDLFVSRSKEEAKEMEVKKDLDDKFSLILRFPSVSVEE